jgi:hypothetical protein
MDPNNVTATAAASGHTTTTPSMSASAPTANKRFPTAAKIGLAVGAGAIVIFAIVGALCLYRRQRVGKLSQVDSGSTYSLQVMSTSTSQQTGVGASHKEIFRPEQKMYLGPNDLEPKSLWVERQRLRTPS